MVTLCRSCQSYRPGTLGPGYCEFKKRPWTAKHERCNDGYKRRKKGQAKPQTLVMTLDGSTKLEKEVMELYNKTFKKAKISPQDPKTMNPLAKESSDG